MRASLPRIETHAVAPDTRDFYQPTSSSSAIRAVRDNRKRALPARNGGRPDRAHRKSLLLQVLGCVKCCFILPDQHRHNLAGAVPRYRIPCAAALAANRSARERNSSPLLVHPHCQPECRPICPRQIRRHRRAENKRACVIDEMLLQDALARRQTLPRNPGLSRR